jgi:hypothetical protein
MGKQNRSLVFEMKEMKCYEEKANGQDYFVFEGYLSTFGNKDLGGDVCVAGCFAESLASRKVKLLWQHNWDEPIGIFEEIREDQKGLFVKGKLPMSDSLVKERIVPQMKIGSIDSMSIGYRTKISRYDVETETRYLEKVELYEGSLVTIPMNPLATVTEGSKKLTGNFCKNLAEISHKWDAVESERRVKELGVETDTDLNIYVVIDGKIAVVPRALFCLKSHIAGAKKGFDGDIEEAFEVLNKYYEMLELDKPFRSNDIKEAVFSEVEVKNLPKSEMSYVLRNCCLSKDCSDNISKLLMSSANEDDPEKADLEERKAVEEMLKILETGISNLKM